MVTAPGSGAEIIPFLKTWVNLPMAIGFTVLYAKVQGIPCPVPHFFKQPLGPQLQQDVLPLTHIAVHCAQLANVLSTEQLFYACIIPFIVFFGSFAFFMYPLRDVLHPTGAFMHLALGRLASMQCC